MGTSTLSREKQKWVQNREWVMGLVIRLDLLSVRFLSVIRALCSFPVPYSPFQRTVAVYCP